MTDPSAATDRPATPRDLRDRAMVAAARAVLASGGTCRVRDRVGAVRVLALDSLSAETLERAGGIAAAGARLVLTGPRARTLGLAVPLASTVALAVPPGTDVAALRALADVPTGPAAAVLARGLPLGEARDAERAGIELAKRAALLPAVLALPDAAAAPGAGEAADIAVDAREVFAQRALEIASLAPAVEVPLPIAAAEDARLVAFRSSAGGAEQVALLVGRPEAARAPLCRLHSECLTGDLFGSLRCDCGEQLDGAIRRMAEEGAGVLLYLRQEGRGIGLVNKLRAYRLQDSGLDTVDANTHLGFQPDERDFAVAAAMLRRLGVGRVRLLTNNPDKLEAMVRQGVAVEERVPLLFATNRHNRGYLETKARRSGHLLRVLEGGRAVSATGAGAGGGRGGGAVAEALEALTRLQGHGIAGRGLGA